MTESIKFILDFNLKSIKDFPKTYRNKQIDYLAGEIEGLWLGDAITYRERNEYKDKLKKIYEEVNANGTEDEEHY